MSYATMGVQGRHPSPQGLSSNNPFRNRGISNTRTGAQPTAPAAPPIQSPGLSPYTPPVAFGGTSPGSSQTSPYTQATLLPPMAPVSPLQAPTAAAGPEGGGLSPVQRTARPMSTNPFLSDQESQNFASFLNAAAAQKEQQQQQQQQQRGFQPGPAQRQQGQLAGLDAFESLSLNNNNNTAQPPRNGSLNTAPQRILQHPRTFDDYTDFSRTAPRSRPPHTTTNRPKNAGEGLLIDIFADPEPMGAPNTAGRSGSHGGGPTTTTTTTTTYANNRQPPFAPVSSRPRRNSDTSIMERPSQRFERFEGEEDRRRREKERERRYREMSHREKDREHGYGYRERRGDREYDRDKERERERRHRYKEGERERGTRHREREGKDKDGKHQKSSKPNRKLDVIDKLDLTGVYGLGQFHHDGPFDACNPHRNRKGIRAAPMQAFAEDSPNMLPTGGGPKSFDHNLYHGRSHDPAMDFSRAAIKNVLATQNAQPKADVATYDPKGKIEPVHGAESMGLGTSTFLDGAPASKAAIQARNEDAPVPGAGSMGGAGAGAGGLQRKKSLAQKLRGVAGGNRVDRSARETTSPEPLDGEAGYGGAGGEGVRRPSIPLRKGSAQSSGAGKGGARGRGVSGSSGDSFEVPKPPSPDRSRKPGRLGGEAVAGVGEAGKDRFVVEEVESELDDFGQPVQRGRQKSVGRLTEGHARHGGSGSGSGSGSGGGLLGRMKSLRKR